MKSASAPLIAFLNTSRQMVIADLYTISVQRVHWQDEVGLVFTRQNYRYTSWDVPLTYAGNTYSATGPLIERDRVRSVIGVEVDTLRLRVYADDAMLMEGQPFIRAAVKGVLDGATVQLDRAFLDGSTIVGTVSMFSGRVSHVEASRSQASIDVASDVELLNTSMPRKLYQAGCQHTLYDIGCGLNQDNFSTEGTVTSATTTSITTTLAQAAGYWDLGGLIFKSGDNDGVLRTVKSWSGIAIELVSPLPFVPAVGDIFQVYAGCTKTQATCTSKFNNVVRFKGFPYIPSPETMR